MNFVVAVLLLVVDEETAFWCLAAVVEKLLPGHFCSNMAMSLVDQGVLRELLVREDPELMAHLEELQVVPSLVSTQWLLTCFVGSAMPLSALLRLWDCMFYEGNIGFLFRAACALMKLHRHRLLAADNTADAYTTLVGLGARLPDVDALIDTAYALPWDSLLQPRQLAGLRQTFAQRMVREDSPAADQAAAATAVAAAAVAEAEAKGSGQRSVAQANRQLPTALAAAPGSGSDSGGWTLIPVAVSADSDERHEGWQSEGWNLVERERGGAACASSLSYVILQMETPKLVEEYFGDAGGELARRKAQQQGRAGGLIATIMGKLDALVNEPEPDKGTIVIAF
tara:strand:+ start:554 stop:1573 length:1020 start_codon:yes stop_codon:yes gene_type:complete